MRRLCGDTNLADDLSQQVFLQAWRTIPQLQRPNRFPAWLKRMSINVWFQYLRKKDPLRNAAGFAEITQAKQDAPGIAMDLDRALATLAEQVRLCIVLSYHEGMTHAEIAAHTDVPVGTVKSHIRRGTQRLQQLLSAYENAPCVEEQQ